MAAEGSGMRISVTLVWVWVCSGARCPGGQFYHESQCHDCRIPGCLRCDAEQCLECEGREWILEAGECRWKMDPECEKMREQGRTRNLSCLIKCHDLCLECFGSGQDQCLKCHNFPHVFRNKSSCFVADPQSKDVCGSGRGVGFDQTCDACPVNCVECRMDKSLPRTKLPLFECVKCASHTRLEQGSAELSCPIHRLHLGLWFGLRTRRCSRPQLWGNLLFLT
ncbi:hypothetical protein DSO57_1020393 [Entomophthora muscae]|uniref:Uncharacterized protein n=1 Tax=Entomophthora muscae TaxID=34485 RepID=A0ACC2RIJ2_9FUNG|nr:hypothetical protein DSO57_1020393 [Entomophthora muscae]